MRKPVSIIATLALGLWPQSRGPHASQANAPAPPVTKDRIAGTWEGLTTGHLGNSRHIFPISPPATLAENATFLSHRNCSVYSRRDLHSVAGHLVPTSRSAAAAERHGVSQTARDE